MSEVMMDNRVWKSVISHAEAIVAPRVCDQLSDAELLQRFLQQKDDASFAAIVRRHGPLVWGVCRHLAANESDAEDAYQASFLALFRNAHRIRQPNALGAWLHCVAGRVCRDSLRALARRRQHERSAAVAEMVQPIGAHTWDEWHRLLHREIDRMPEVLRIPFILCVLQGITQVEASKQLGWKRTTLTKRLIQAKERLARALDRQGLTGAAAVVTAVGCGSYCAPLSARLTEKALIPSLGGMGKSLAPHIHQLAQAATGGVMTQMKWLAATAVTGIALMGVGGNHFAQVDAQSPNPVKKPAPTASANTARPTGKSAQTDTVWSATVPSDTKVQYEFVQFPNNKELQAKFETTLIERGQKGWEYAGVSPAGNKLVFKKVQRGSTAEPMAANAYYGLATNVPPSVFEESNLAPPPPSPNYPVPATRPAPVSPRSPIRADSPVPPTSVPDLEVSPSPLRPSQAANRDQLIPDAVTPPASNPPLAPPSDDLRPGRVLNYNSFNVKRDPQIVLLRVGEVMRLRYANDIEKIYAFNPKVVEVTLDPSNPKRLILKALSQGDSQLDITSEIGANSQLEVFQIKVK